MINWNGWYSLTAITDVNELKQLYKDALEFSINTMCDVKDDHYKRIHDPTITPNEWIEKYLSLTTHNGICNRYEYNNKAKWAEQFGEIASCTMHLPYDKFLWIYVSLENLEILVEKYNLPKM